MKYFTQPPLGTPLNFAHPLNRELVGYWPMGEGAGIRAQDLSGKGNHGTLTNMVQGSTSGWTGGKFGRAINFDGTNDFIAVNSKNLDINGRVATVSFWFKHRPVSAFATEIFCEYSVNFNFTDAFVITFNNNGGGVPPTMGGIEAASRCSTYLIYATNNRFDDGQWHCVTIVYNNNLTTIAEQIMIFVDGASQAKTIVGVHNNLQTSNFTNNPFFIGDRIGGSAAPFKESLTEFRIYNRALSAMEIQQLYTDPFCMFEQHNKFRWLTTFDRKGSFFFSRL